MIKENNSYFLLFFNTLIYTILFMEVYMKKIIFKGVGTAIITPFNEERCRY